MNHLTDKELIELAENDLGDKIVEAIVTKGHLAIDWPNSIVATRREINGKGDAETIHDLYIWEGTYHKFSQVKELYREVDTVKRSTINLRRRIMSLYNDIGKLHDYANTDMDYVTETLTKVRSEISIILKSII
tara:strand:- start:724 stop:1122 length:399 start_codon:yes stop_codon:yes gene_type:complete